MPLDFGTLPAFILYFVTSTVLFLVAAFVYHWVTPYHELELIGQGNVAVAVSYSGAMLGLALPLASLAAHSVSLLDLGSWAVAALATQLVVYFAVHFLLKRRLDAQIVSGNVAVGTFLGALSVVFGLLNAACLTY